MLNLDFGENHESSSSLRVLTFKQNLTVTVIVMVRLDWGVGRGSRVGWKLAKEFQVL